MEIEDIRRQTEEARRIVEEKKAQAQQLQEQLDEQERAVPSTTSQTALRQRFSGQQGIVQRRQIEQVRQGIQQRKADVSEYGQELGRYEQQVAQSEANIKDYDARYADYLRAKKEASADAEYQQQQLQEAVNRYNSGEPLDVAFKGFNVDLLVKKGYLKFDEAASPELKSSAVDKFNQDINQQPNLPFLNDRTANVQVQSKMPKFSTGIGLVSAQQIELNPNTGRPYGTLTKAEKKAFKDYKNEEGYVKGSLSYLGNKISGAIDRRQLKSGDYYQQEAMRNVGQILPSAAAYSTPYLGETLLIAGGTETVIRNVPKIKTQPKESLINIGQGTSEIVLGGVGGGLRYNAARVGRESKALENAQTLVRGVRVETPKGGVDYIFGIKSTKPKGFMDKVLMVRPQTAISRIEQPFVNTKKGAVLENGRAYSVILKQGKIKTEFTSAAYRQSGRATRVNNAEAVSMRNGNYARSPIDAEISMGKIRMRKAVTQTGTIKKNRNPLFSDEFFIKQRTETFKGNDFDDVYFGGMAKQNKNVKEVYNILSGKVDKVRVYGDGFYKPKAIVRPDVKGKIRRIKLETPGADDGWSMFIGGSGRKSSPGYLQSLYPTESMAGSAATAEQAINKAIPKSDFAGIIGVKPTVSSQVGSRTESVSIWTGTGQYERTESSAVLMPNEKGKDLISFGNIHRTKLKVGQKPRLRERQKNELMSGFQEAFGLGQTPKSRLGLRTGQTSRQRLRQKQLQQSQQSSINWLTGERTFPRTTGGFKPSVSFSTKGGKVVKTEPGRYLVLVRRFGQDNVIGEATTLEEAKRILRNNLEGTLAASGFIAHKGTSKKVKVNEMFGGMYAPSKRDVYRVVQRRGKRLSSRSEVSEIWSFKKRAAKSKAPRRLKWW